jgi:tetratricopeptide (TPR) repeat protein
MERKAQRLRDRKILEMIRGLFLAQIAFQEIFKKYKRRQLHFSDVEHWVDDRGQSLLYLLKEHCHDIFRFTTTDSFHRKEWLLDLAIGSIFHEAMKLRENIYQLEVYRPQYLQYKLKAGKTVYEQDYLKQFEKIMLRAEQGLTEGMEETRSLFQDAKAHLLDFFKASSENPYLVRFLLEHQSLLGKVYGAKRAREIFHLLFETGFLGANLVAGQSYLESEHYDLSTLYFLKALKLNPRHLVLQFLLNLSQGMDAYYRNDYPKALSYFSKLTRLPADGKLKKEFLKKAGEACMKIASEWKEEKGPKAAARARSVAEQMKRML